MCLNGPRHCLFVPVQMVKFQSIADPRDDRIRHPWSRTLANVRFAPYVGSVEVSFEAS